MTSWRLVGGTHTNTPEEQGVNLKSISGETLLTQLNLVPRNLETG